LHFIKILEKKLRSKVTQHERSSSSFYLPWRRLVSVLRRGQPSALRRQQPSVLHRCLVPGPRQQLQEPSVQRQLHLDRDPRLPLLQVPQ